MPSRTEADISPERYLQMWPAHPGSPSPPPELSWTVARYGGTACAVARPRSALTAASSILSSVKLTGWAARCNCLTGLGVTAISHHASDARCAGRARVVPRGSARFRVGHGGTSPDGQRLRDLESVGGSRLGRPLLGVGRHSGRRWRTRTLSGPSQIGA